MDQTGGTLIRAGFVYPFHDGWLGGINYFRNLMAALYAFPERKIDVVVFTAPDTAIDVLDDFPDIVIVRSRLFERGSLPWLIRKLWLRAFSHDLLLERLLKKHGVAVLSHSGWIGKRARIPTIGWIPDFQHVHLPEFFSSHEIEVRNKAFHETCDNCTRVIVSSFDALDDLIRFSPACKGRSDVLQFAVTRQNDTSALLPMGVLEERYNFSGKFFLLPNQFWKHKNHGVVIEALGLLFRENKIVLVLSTGNTEDYRHPEYFKSLMDRISELGIQGCFRVLGLIPHDDLEALMNYSSAIINPSYFEGWSTSVEEAKSLGKHVILSDIPVHREQNPAQADYFPPGNPQALATVLWNSWNISSSEGKSTSPTDNCLVNDMRMAFARNYQEIVKKTIGNYNESSISSG